MKLPTSWYLTPLLLLALLIPDFAVAQTDFVTCDGPQCGARDFVEMIRTIIFWLAAVFTIIAVGIIMYAGVRLAISAGNMTDKDAAKELLINGLVGLAIVLASWFIVETIFQILRGEFQTNVPSTSQPPVGGPTNVSFQSAGIQNAPPLGSPYYDIPMDMGGTGIRGMGGVEYPEGDPAQAPEPYEEGDCSVDNLMSYGMTETEATVMSCIAQPESGCNLNAQNPWSSARGPFQIVRGLDNQCHNLNLPECTEAAQSAGFDVSGNLNCSDAFTGGTSASNPSRAVPGREQRFEACNAAASTMGCNVGAARCLMEDGGFNPWLGNRNQNHHQAQRACVSRYGN